MQASEIVPLTRDAVKSLLDSRGRKHKPLRGAEKRQLPRWPFQGAVELWLGDPDDCDGYALATCENLSGGGVGIRYEQQIDPGVVLNIAIHQPEQSLHGRAVVRHCTRLHHDYYIGLEFLF